MQQSAVQGAGAAAGEHSRLASRKKRGCRSAAEDSSGGSGSGAVGRQSPHCCQTPLLGTIARHRTCPTTSYLLSNVRSHSARDSSSVLVRSSSLHSRAREGCIAFVRVVLQVGSGRQSWLSSSAFVGSSGLHSKAVQARCGCALSAPPSHPTSTHSLLTAPTCRCTPSPPPPPWPAPGPPPCPQTGCTPRLLREGGGGWAVEGHVLNMLFVCRSLSRHAHSFVVIRQCKGWTYIL